METLLVAALKPLPTLPSPLVHRRIRVPRPLPMLIPGLPLPVRPQAIPWPTADHMTLLLPEKIFTPRLPLLTAIQLRPLRRQLRHLSFPDTQPTHRHRSADSRRHRLGPATMDLGTKRGRQVPKGKHRDDQSHGRHLTLTLHISRKRWRLGYIEWRLILDRLDLKESTDFPVDGFPIAARSPNISSFLSNVSTSEKSA